MDFLVRQEGEVRKQLSRQAGAHSDHIKDVLAVQREQLQLEFQRELNCKILEERENFQSEVAGWISRLKGIESAVDGKFLLKFVIEINNGRGFGGAHFEMPFN